MVEPVELTWDDLREPEEITQRFTPLGFATSSKLKPEASVRFLQRMIAKATLIADVPEDLHKYLTRLRRLHIYGLLEYEFFTAANDLVYLFLEAAFRVRFITYYSRKVPVLRNGHAEVLEANSFDDVLKALRREQRKKEQYILLSKDGVRQYPIPAGFPGLLRWARDERLLIGQRTAILDDVIVRIRNRVAHPEQYSLQMPVDSARSLCDAAEIVNKLWDYDTPGGRLFPAPLQRWLRVVAVTPDGTGSIEFLTPDQVRGAEPEHRGWTYVFFSAVEQEELVGLPLDHSPGLAFVPRPGFEMTAYPCDWLWGPGTWEDAITQLAEYPDDWLLDTVRYLDRLFLIRSIGPELDQPRSPAILLGLDQSSQNGTWLAILADHPWDAYRHARDHGTKTKVPEVRTCQQCRGRLLGRFTTWEGARRFARDWSASNT
jgi:hypothetical protein